MSKNKTEEAKDNLDDNLELKLNDNKKEPIYVYSLPSLRPKVRYSDEVGDEENWNNYIKKLEEKCGSECSAHEPINYGTEEKREKCPVELTDKLHNVLYYAAIYHPTDPDHYEKLVKDLSEDELEQLDKYLEILKKDLKEKERGMSKRGGFDYTYIEDGKKYLKIVDTKYEYKGPLSTMGSDEVENVQKQLKHFKDTGKFVKIGLEACPSCNNDSEYKPVWNILQSL